MVKFIAPTHHIECNKDEKIYLTFKCRNSFSTGKEAIPAGMWTLKVYAFYTRPYLVKLLHFTHFLSSRHTMSKDNCKHQLLMAVKYAKKIVAIIKDTTYAVAKRKPDKISSFTKFEP